MSVEFGSRIIDSNALPVGLVIINKLQVDRVYLVRIVCLLIVEMNNECIIVTSIDHISIFGWIRWSNIDYALQSKIKHSVP